MNAIKPGQSMFNLVKSMNEAFGNLQGDPAHIDLKMLDMQAKSIGSEFVELMKALGYEVQMKIECVTPEGFKPDMDEVRDALCDIMVFALGTFHRMGINAELDMESVVEALLTRFCKDEAELLASRAKYDMENVAYTVHGNFPRVFLRSAVDQKMPEYPKGKFLKSAGHQKPKFYRLTNASRVENKDSSSPPRNYIGKASTDAITQSRTRLWEQWREAAVAAFAAELDKTTDAQKDSVLYGEFEVVHVMRRKGEQL